MPGSGAFAYCPSTLSAIDRIQCQVQESEAQAFQQNDQQNLRTYIEDQNRFQQQREYYAQQQWQQQQQRFDPYGRRR